MITNNAQGPLAITREMYLLADILLTLDDLKRDGLVAGGYEVDRDALTAIQCLGQKQGYEKATKAEVDRIMRKLTERRAG